MGKQSKITIGHRYYMSIHMGLNYGEVDELVEIKAGDRIIWKYNPSAPPLPSEASFAALDEWKNSGYAAITDPPSIAMPAYEYEKNDRVEWPIQVTSNQSLRIKASKIFGGEESEGGIDGTLDVMLGADDQTVSSRLQQMFGGLVPAYRKRFTVLFDGMICAMSKYPKAWAFRRRRLLKGWDGGVWYPEKLVISLDGGKIKAMNGAHILYESMTNRHWGASRPRARLDDASFRAAADQLYNENFGLCLKWSRQGKIREFLDIVQNHIGANLFVHPVTGLWTLRLVRDNYDVNTLPSFDKNSGLLGIDDDDTASSVSGTNEVIVNYVRPADNQEASVRVQNAAAIRAASGILSETVDYPGIPTPELALRVAQRDLRTKVGLKKYKIRLDRRGYLIEPGGVFRISDPARGIENLVLRAGKIEEGELSSGKITITAVMDVFGLPANSFVAVQPPLYTPPSIAPAPITQRLISQITYRDLSARVDSTTLANITPGTGFISAIASQPTGLSIGYQLDTRVGTTGSWNSTNGDFAPSALLVNPITIGVSPVVITFSAGINIDTVELGSAALIDGEIYRVDVLDSEAGVATLARGCVDTIPATHSAGARIWFYQDLNTIDTTEYAAGVTVNVRMLTKTGAGTLPASSATVDTYVMTRRHELPYPPANVKLNGVNYPVYIGGELTVSWSHRDRLLQADQLVDQLIGSVGPEPDVTYSLVVKGEGGTAIATVSTSASSYSVTRAQEYSSGKFDAANTRDLRIGGLAVVSSTLATNIGVRSNRVDGGWMNVSSFGSGLSNNSRFVDGSTGAITHRSFSPAWTTATLTTGFTLNPTVYQSNIANDPYVGWAVKVSASFPGGPPATDLSTHDAAINIIRDRRSTARAVVGLSKKQFGLTYWVTTESARRAIFREQFLIHTVTKTAIVTGPLTSTRTLVGDFYRADMSQFDDPSIYVTAGMPTAPGARIAPGYIGQPDVYASCAIIFGGLLYVPWYNSATTQSTSGRAVNITNAINAHINITTQLAEVTKVYSIDLDGVISLLDTRTGLVLADQVSATLGVEITDATIRTVNHSTGALGSIIATLPGSTKAVRVVGDTATETFYVVAENSFIYRYDLAGTLMASLNLDLSPFFPQVTYPESLIITAGYVYFGFGLLGRIRRIEKNLSSFSVLSMEALTGIPDYLSDWVAADTTNTQFFAGKLFDEAAASTSVTPIATPRLNDTVTIELNSSRDGLDSHQKHIITTKRIGYGLRYGTYGG